LLNTLQASSMLPHFAYMLTKLLPTKTSDSKPLWLMSWWTHLPSSIATMLAHAFSTPTKVTESGTHLPVAFVEIVQVPSALAHISHVPLSWCSKWPHFEMASCWTLQASSMLPHFAYMSTNLLPTKTSHSQLVWTSCL